MALITLSAFGFTHSQASCGCRKLHLREPFLTPGLRLQWLVAQGKESDTCMHARMACPLSCPAILSRYFDADTVGLDFKGLMADIEAAPEGSVIVLHGAATQRAHACMHRLVHQPAGGTHGSARHACMAVRHLGDVIDLKPRSRRLNKLVAAIFASCAEAPCAPAGSEREGRV